MPWGATVGDQKRSSTRAPRPAGRSGFTMIDIAIAVVILVVAVGSLSSAVVASLEVARSNEETSLANAAVRRAAERMRAVTFRDVFRRYNEDPSDDPGVPGSAEGAGFAVRGLTVLPGDPDGMVGSILFPTLDDGTGKMVLREDVEDADLGMPRDLNGDGTIDSADHRLDYLILPVRIRLAWSGESGNRTLDLHSALARP